MTGSLQVEAPDLTGLNELVSGLSGALTGNGSGDGDLHRLLKTEAGQLAWEISDQLGPRSKESQDAKVDKEVRGFLTAKPEYSNLYGDQQYSSIADFTWLAAGPNFLLGINDEDNQPGASGEQALEFLRAGQRSGARGKAYVMMGQRGRFKQSIMRLNRTRVSKSAFSSVKRTIREKFGQLRASFAFTASQLIPQKRVPAWVSRHFATRASGKAVFNDAGLGSPTEPFIEFGSRAPGVESNPTITGVFRSAVETRKFITRSKLEKVLKGYAYDWNTGRVFHRRESQEN